MLACAVRRMCAARPQRTSVRFLMSEVCIFEQDDGSMMLHIEDYDDFEEKVFLRTLKRLRIEKVDTIHSSFDPAETWLEVHTRDEKTFRLDYQFEGLDKGIHIHSDDDELMHSICKILNRSRKFDLYDERVVDDDDLDLDELGDFGLRLLP